MRKTFGVTLLALLFALVYSQRYVPIDKMTDQDLDNWIKPPNRQIFQRTFLERMLRTMDPRADPCEDFYQFACGNYDAVMPQTTGYNAMFPIQEVVFLSNKLRDNLILSTAKNRASENERKVWNFYQSCMNIKRDPHTAMDFVRSFGSWPAFDNSWRPESFDWMERMVELIKVGVHIFFETTTSGQMKGKEYVDTTSLVLGPMMPYGELITQKELFGKLKSLFSAHLPVSYIEDMSHRISAFHNELYRIMSVMKSLDDFEEFYIHELRRVVPSCDLTRIVALLINRQPNPTNTIRIDRNTVEKVCAFVEKTDKRTIADTMLYYLYDYAQMELSFMKDFDDENLQSTCFENTTILLQPIVAKMFVDKYVTKETWQEAAILMKNLHQIGVEMMSSETKWLDEATRWRAVKKMEGLSSHIIYPNSTFLPDTSLTHVDVDAGNFMQNVRRLKGAIFEDTNGLLGKAVGSWKFNTLEANVHILNGYRGHIRVQAALLQPPYYSIFTPSFWTFGAPLIYFGHETMHAFDAETGVKWDEFGRNNHMISPVRRLVHESLSECFYTQFEKFKINGTEEHVKGALTMGENVADNDGIKLSFKLFKRWMAENPDIVWQEEFSFAPLQLTHEQAFFLSFGQINCDRRSFEEQVKQLYEDEHAPGKFRVNGGVANSRDFARAFNCPVNSKMNPLEKCNYFFD